MKFTDKRQRRDILRGSKNLQSCEDEVIAKISIAKDLTFSQRQDNKTVREEIKKEFEEE